MCCVGGCFRTCAVSNGVDGLVDAVNVYVVVEVEVAVAVGVGRCWKDSCQCDRGLNVQGVFQLKFCWLDATMSALYVGDSDLPLVGAASPHVWSCQDSGDSSA